MSAIRSNHRFIPDSPVKRVPPAAFIGALVSWGVMEQIFTDTAVGESGGMTGLVFVPWVAAVVAGFSRAAWGFDSSFNNRPLCSAPSHWLTVFGIGLIAMLPVGEIYAACVGCGEYSGAVALSAGSARVLEARSLSWSILGTVIGLGIALSIRHPRIMLVTTVGGFLGGAVAGALFDPLYVLTAEHFQGSAWVSRAIGFSLPGLMASLFGTVAYRTETGAGFRIMSGPSAGKGYLLTRGPRIIGTDEDSDVRLPSEESFGPIKVVIRRVGFSFEVECPGPLSIVAVNGRSVRRGRLGHGDVMQLGTTVIRFFLLQPGEKMRDDFSAEKPPAS
ncbi:MAG: FHA domain-containing protein [Pseudomonadota bacterium]